MMDMTRESILAWVADVLNERGWSAADWCRAAGIPQSTLSRFMKGDTRAMSTTTLGKLAHAAGGLAGRTVGRPFVTSFGLPALGEEGAPQLDEAVLVRCIEVALRSLQDAGAAKYGFDPESIAGAIVEHYKKQIRDVQSLHETIKRSVSRLGPSGDLDD